MLLTNAVDPRSSEGRTPGTQFAKQRWPILCWIVVSGGFLVPSVLSRFAFLTPVLLVVASVSCGDVDEPSQDSTAVATEAMRPPDDGCGTCGPGQVCSGGQCRRMTCT